MKFAVSNIAWSPNQRLAAYSLLKDHDFTGVEIAPALLFAGEADPFAPSAQILRERLDEIERLGLELVSMQSVLFGAEGAELFGSPAAVERLTASLTRAIELAGCLRIPNLVFGAPKQRIVPPDFPHEAVSARVREVLLPLADLAETRGTRIALEPNAAGYGTNFMTSFPETIDVVRAINHPAVTLNFDTGALYMTDSFDQVASFAADARERVSHVHLSSPYLAPAPSTEADARAVLEALATTGYDRAVSIEMKAMPDEDLATLARSIGLLHAAARGGGHL